MTSSIGRFEIIGVVADHSASTVWKGHDPGLDRDVALKQVPVTDRDALARLRSEAHHLSGLRHPNLVQVFEIIETSDHVWLVEEWVDGAALPAVIAACGQLAARQAVAILRGALCGLAHAHEQGIVHGDVSPSNILVDIGGTSRLIDFGLAAVAGTPATSGTPGYISPEAIHGQPITPRTDVYSSAAVLAAMLTGRPVFAATTPVETVARQLTHPRPDLGGIDAHIGQVLAHALDSDPANRPADAAQLLAELDEACDRGFGTGWLAEAGVVALITTTMLTAAGLAVRAVSTPAVATTGPPTAAPGTGAGPSSMSLVAKQSVRRSRRLLTVTGSVAVLVVAALIIILTQRNAPVGANDGPPLSPTTAAGSTAPAANGPATIGSTAGDAIESATSGVLVEPAATTTSAGAAPLIFTNNTASLTFTLLSTCETCQPAEPGGTVALVPSLNASRSIDGTYNAGFSTADLGSGYLNFHGFSAGAFEVPPGGPPPSADASFQIGMLLPSLAGNNADQIFAQTGNVGSGYVGTCTITISPNADESISGTATCPSLRTLIPGDEATLTYEVALEVTFTLAR